MRGRPFTEKLRWMGDLPCLLKKNTSDQKFKNAVYNIIDLRPLIKTTGVFIKNRILHLKRQAIILNILTFIQNNSIYSSPAPISHIAADSPFFALASHYPLINRCLPAALRPKRVEVKEGVTANGRSSKPARCLLLFSFKGSRSIVLCF